MTKQQMEEKCLIGSSKIEEEEELWQESEFALCVYAHMRLVDVLFLH